MSTNATINLKTANGKYKQTYLHWDGYVDGAGEILRNNYADEAKVKELIKLGDLSILGSEIGEKHCFEDNTKRNWCKAYGRDRGERGTKAQVFDDFATLKRDGLQEQYNYFYIDGKWFVCHTITEDSLLPLTDVEVDV